jgi:hypothetical protein
MTRANEKLRLRRLQEMDSEKACQPPAQHQLDIRFDDEPQSVETRLRPFFP